MAERRGCNGGGQSAHRALPVTPPMLLSFLAAHHLPPAPVGRGRQYPTPVASLTRDQLPPRAGCRRWGT